MLRAYLRLVLFALGLLIGVQAPGFVDQYSKRVSAHYIEAKKNFAGFQHTADAYFGGSMAALVSRLVPPLWIYLALTVGALLYTALFGLGAFAYRTLYLQHPNTATIRS